MISLHQGSLQGDQICDGDNLDQQLFTPTGIRTWSSQFCICDLAQHNFSLETRQRALVEFIINKACSITAVIRWTVWSLNLAKNSTTRWKCRSWTWNNPAETFGVGFAPHSRASTVKPKSMQGEPHRQSPEWESSPNGKSRTPHRPATEKKIITLNISRCRIT